MNTVTILNDIPNNNDLQDWMHENYVKKQIKKTKEAIVEGNKDLVVKHLKGLSLNERNRNDEDNLLIFAVSHCPLEKNDLITFLLSEGKLNPSLISHKNHARFEALVKRTPEENSRFLKIKYPQIFEERHYTGQFDFNPSVRYGNLEVARKPFILHVQKRVFEIFRETITGNIEVGTMICDYMGLQESDIDSSIDIRAEEIRKQIEEEAQDKVHIDAEEADFRRNNKGHQTPSIFTEQCLAVCVIQ